ncbi:MAG: adenylosuccinate synthase [bacterium]|nr:adenylosuccinate synthase [bacterium]
MKNTVVIGAQWGDEGKAKITDLLASRADLIIRYQGGCNAGHTVVTNGVTYKFHLIPSGILYNKAVCFIGAGVVIHPESFEKEFNELKAQGVKFDNLKISPLATITMPYNIEVDGWNEANSGKGKIGTTKRGIGPTYTDKMARIALKIQDLYSFEALNEKLDMILPIKNKTLEKVYGLEPYTKDCLISLCETYAELFRPYVCFEWQDMLNRFKDKTILFEGAQGVMLDIDYGTYPFVTSSNPIGGGAATGSGYGPCMIQDVVGVTKAYVTRVGEGPFVTELTDETGKRIQDVGHEFGVTTGRPRRCGWFDAVIMKYAVLVGGITNVALTKLDVFDDFDEIKICVAYKDCRNDKVYTTYPTDVFIHKYLEPIYETVEGWKTSLSEMKSYDELPENTKKYIAKVEDLIGAPVGIISVGPDREQTIFVEK